MAFKRPQVHFAADSASSFSTLQALRTSNRCDGAAPVHLGTSGRVECIESGVEPLRLEELALSEEDRSAVFRQALGYTQTNGTIELRFADRRAISWGNRRSRRGHQRRFRSQLHHPLASARARRRGRHDDAELHAGVSIARAFGARVRPWPLRVSRDGSRWEPDFEALESAISPATKIIFICNPNNPTGARQRPRS